MRLMEDEQIDHDIDDALIEESGIDYDKDKSYPSMMDDGPSPRLQSNQLWDPSTFYPLDQNDKCCQSYLERKSTVLSNVSQLIKKKFKNDEEKQK